MTSAEKKMIEENLDLVFEFEKYVLGIRRSLKRFRATPWYL